MQILIPVWLKNLSPWYLLRREMLDDFTLALSVFPGEEDLIYLSQAINLSGPALSHDPRQLPAQILDRLENTQVCVHFDIVH